MLESIKEKNTFTITTGHQLNLFTGPIYFLYKILTTINLCDELTQKYPKFNFIPVYWMATEDHDFKEINHFNFENYNIEWRSDQTGIVGEFSTSKLNTVIDEVKRIFPDNKNSNENEENNSDSLEKKSDVENINEGIDGIDDANEFRLDDDLGNENEENQQSENIVQKKNLNLHLGLSPWYKGSATLFWPFYFLQPNYSTPRIVFITIFSADSIFDSIVFFSCCISFVDLFNISSAFFLLI